ncbi:N-acetylneuraminate synthase family protein [Paramagnetospirillum kuznetsovii]|nr:N-acetylneuraminate synthase family protein [Paramagnetospirillum kuznetsovii]
MTDGHHTLIDQIARGPHPFVIAEIGINHNGDEALAAQMIEATAAAGADCVKMQSFHVDEYLSPLAAKAAYQEQGPFAGKSQYEIIKACELDIAAMARLKRHAERLGLVFLSTPFERVSLREVLSLAPQAIKVSSCNLTNTPFLEELAASRIPVLLSTGMADLAEVARAVAIFKAAGTSLLLFQCTSNYPSKTENANLRVMDTYRAVFEVPVGFSDHTPDHVAAIAAVARGAVAIEKHFTLSRDLPGIDQKASIEPGQLTELVRVVRLTRAALGSPVKVRCGEEEDTTRALRRSLVALRDLPVGTRLAASDVAPKRPGTGLAVDQLDRFEGRQLTRPVAAHQPLQLDDFLL